jgi:hypothetical protein
VIAIFGDAAPELFCEEIMSNRWVECYDTVTLERLVENPYDYGIFYGCRSLRNVLHFVRDHPTAVAGARESALRKVQRRIAAAGSVSSHPVRLEYRIARQLQTVHRELAWAELDRRLGVRSRIWNQKRYTLLARELCVLATMHEYWRQRWPNAGPPANTPTGEKVRTLSRAMAAGWRSVRDYLELLGISWKIDIVSRLTESDRIAEGLRGESKKALYCDHHGGAWLVKYDDESILNPVLATIFSRLTGCPGGDLCPVLLDYDPRSGQACSVQPYLKAERIRRFAWCSTKDYSALFGGTRLRASQALCQAVHEWLLGNSDGYQVIMDAHGNLIFIDQDRSFFHGGQPSTTKRNSRARSTTSYTANGVDHQDDASRIRTSLIQATMAIDGVGEDLAEYISRVEAMPDAIYEGLARNASYRGNELCSLFHVDTSDPSALALVSSLERWIEILLDRKRSVRKRIVKRLRQVLGTETCFSLESVAFGNR